VQLPIRETHTDETPCELTDMGSDQLDALLSGGNSDALRKALAPVVAARSKVHGLETQIAAKQSEIQNVEADSARLAGNLRSLKDTEEERALARRYAGEMNPDEDQIETLRSDLTGLRQQLTAAQNALDQTISSLDPAGRGPLKRSLSAASYRSV
jgi:chromosome segregation ATPase